MLAPSPNLLRAGLALKVNHLKLATRSYLRDRANQTTDRVISYAVAAGLFAAAGIFLLAAVLVGITALFRWIEIRYGLFQAFGAVGALLLVMSAITAGVAAGRLRRRPREFPSLSSRLRVAARSGPRLHPAEAAKDAAAILMPSPASPRRPLAHSRSGGNDRTAQIGLILMATLLGLAAARRRRFAREMVPDAPTPVR
jgi:hypothetical protein